MKRKEKDETVTQCMDINKESRQGRCRGREAQKDREDKEEILQ